MSEVHRLDLRDRGVNHKHRWWPHCSCGWIGVYRRRKKEATDMHHQHADAMAKADRSARRPSGPRRDLTPVEDLPEALR